MADILIVEDSPSTAALEARRLTLAGHECRLAATGREALESFDLKHPDLILQDYGLPDTDGLELLKTYLEKDPSTLVVIVTGQGYEQLAADMIKAGAKEYVPKSSQSLNQLVQTVDRVLHEDSIRRELEEKARQNERLLVQSEIAFWVSYNFRNLFSAAMGFLQLIDEDNPRQTKEMRFKYKKQALNSLERSVNLVDQLMSLTEITHTPPTRILPGFMVQQSFKKVRKQMEESEHIGPSFEFVDLTPDLPAVVLRAQDLMLVLENLLRNAVESLDAPGRITVSARKKNEKALEITVQDQGRGMDETTFAKAFVPLFSTKGVVGAGLGLSLVQAAVRRNSGEIDLKSAPGQGTVVTVTWPLSQPESPWS